MKPDEEIDLHLEGRLDPKERERFEEEILADPESLRSYVEQRWLHAELLSDTALLADLAETRTPVAPGPRWAAWAALAAAVALALFSIGALLSTREGNSPTVAILIEAQNCRWEGSDLPTREGARLGTGTLALAEGMATLRFESGATVTLEAPTTLEVESAMRCRLLEGSVVADVPDSAHGFTIDTERMEVIDLGTKFGVTSSAHGGSHVFVFDGEVKVRKDDKKPAKHILSGKSLHLGAEPTSPDEEIIHSTPANSRLRDWIPVSTAFGKGQDAYLRRTDSSGLTGDDPLLMVKHTDLAAGNERRAVLTFDLSSIDRSQVQDIVLTLKMESSGLGFSSLVPNSVFSVYAATRESLHQWKEGELTWKDSPRLTSETLDPALFEPVAKFTIPKGSANSLIEVESDDLTRFLLSRNASLATFLIVRETGEFDKQGLVHAFASKEHPVGPAPTLWFKPVAAP